ncbi:hypothetical protein JCM8097_000858 [Rhodosporidiobolus ruineniae]
MCEEACTSFMYSFMPFCRGDGCCGCNPRCCRSCCTCGFHEDDDRFADKHNADASAGGAKTAGGPPPAEGAAVAAVDASAGGAVPAQYGRTEMKVPSAGGGAA